MWIFKIRQVFRVKDPSRLSIFVHEVRYEIKITSRAREYLDISGNTRRTHIRGQFCNIVASEPYADNRTKQATARPKWTVESSRRTSAGTGRSPSSIPRPPSCSRTLCETTSCVFRIFAKKVQANSFLRSEGFAVPNCTWALRTLQMDRFTAVLVHPC